MAIKSADSYTGSSHTDTNAIRIAHAWISLFLGEKPLSDMRRIGEWQAWATAKLSAGWVVDAVKQAVTDAWTRHARDMGLDEPNVTPGSQLARDLAEAHAAADRGAAPAQVAVFYRSLANENPAHRGWLARFAAIFSDMGDIWAPMNVYTANGW